MSCDEYKVLENRRVGYWLNPPWCKPVNVASLPRGISHDLQISPVMEINRYQLFRIRRD
jgi:hypothetical protein